MIEIENIKMLMSMAKIFKKHGHIVTPSWKIERKTEYLNMVSRGFKLFYHTGFFIWKKPFPGFTNNKNNVGVL